MGKSNTNHSLQPDARSGAFEILQRVEEGGYADLLLDRYLERHSQMERRERGLLTELVYGVLRLRGRVDFALTLVSRQPLQKLEPAARLLLRLGAYQLLELDRVPTHAAVNSTVELARALGKERLVGIINGTLRGLERSRANIDWPTPETPRPYLQHVCSLPQWLAKALLSQHTNREAIALGEALAEAAPFTLRVNTLKTDRDSLLAAMSEAGHSVRPCRYAPEGIILERRSEQPLPGADQGWYQVQDQASMLISHLLAVNPGQRILDCCAAPGGKTTHLAALSDNQCSILALDKHPHRVELIRQGAARLGCTQIDAKQWDLTSAPDFAEAESFDRVLLDAPCSGIGVLRRNPESRWNRTAADVKDLAALQAQLLHQAALLVAPGGSLLYSVCTFTKAETDGVIEHFLQAHPQFKLESLQDGLAESWQELLTEQGTLRTMPQLHDGMDAFYAARLVKA
ncbi:MAG: 16S rRNA (cytosine(967)-C(5))-methyltransferase RsmB [Desulfuromonadales bacterium]|nr:16S rRNA (cytosine(967)-C(5))-methyltransferase RsmB [Desulfuromonadales bacterium]